MPGRLDTVFFLSDYGTKDEFAGVVRAVVRGLAPDVVVIDLTHEVPPFDVASGARTLERAVPHLGEGIVLAVVDPGVGSMRRAIVLRVEGPGRPRTFVGPDNGLLLPAAEAAGLPAEVVELQTPATDHTSATFDGRDVFAPAVAALCKGVALGELGRPVALSGLVRLPRPVATRERLADGRTVRWCEVTWVDRFGNVQLDASPTEGETEAVALRSADGHERVLRRVRAFADLEPGELGLVVDANGRLAVVVREGSASGVLGLGVGHVVGLAGLG